MTFNRKIQIAALAVFINGVVALTVIGPAQAGMPPKIPPCWYCWPPTGTECMGYYKGKGTTCSDMNAQQDACNAVQVAQQQPGGCCPDRWGAPVSCSMMDGQMVVRCNFMRGEKIMGPSGPGHKK